MEDPHSDDTGPWQSTPAMRSRIRELAKPEACDYDRAVIAVLDDLERYHRSRMSALRAAAKDIKDNPPYGSEWNRKHGSRPSK